MNKKIRTLNKIFSWITALSLIFQSSFYSPLLVLAQESTPIPEPSATEITLPLDNPSPSLEPSPTATPSPTLEPSQEPSQGPVVSENPLPTESPTPEPTINISPEPTSTPAPTIVEKECLADGQVIKDTVNEDWNIDIEKGLAETKEKVKLGVKYNFPQENKVSVTFKCLPKDEGLRTSLKIQQIKVSDLKLPEGTNPATEYAYDITTGMTDGTFEYNVTLPKPADKTAEISYIEKTVDEAKNQSLKTEDIMPVDDSKLTQDGDKVIVSSIDHFSIYLATYSNVALTIAKHEFLRGESVYLEATGLTNNSKHYYKLSIVSPDGTITPLTSCTNNISSINSVYALSGTADISTNWTARVRESSDGNSSSDALTKCNNNNGSTTDTKFEVIQQTAQISQASNLICTNDVGGVNDLAGSQKDLTKMCADDTQITWDWDDTAWSGNNSGDACSLFDTDNDGKANYSLCVTVKNTPATYFSKRLYLCNDHDTDRCHGDEVSITGTTICSATVQPDDPFVGGDFYPNDTVAVCNIDLDDVGGGVATLLNVCSYPSQQPNSDPSDCIGKIGGGFITVVKNANPSDGTAFNFNISNASGNLYSPVINGSGTSSRYSLVTNTYSVTETVPSGWNLTSASCINQSGVQQGTFNGNSITGINVASGEDITCTFNDTQQAGTLIVKKVVVNDNGGTKGYSDFSFSVNGAAAVAFEADGQNDLSVNAGTYTVTEPAVAGYAITYNGCSGIVLAAGGSAVCTITNDDQPALLTVTKTVTNDNGGTKQVSDFPLFVGATSVVSGVQHAFSAGTYSVTETGQTGYAATFGGACNTSGQVTLALGDVKTCIITNDDQVGTLIVKKVVVNDNGGILVAKDFTFSVNSGTAVSFEADGQNDLTVNAGTYNIIEPTVIGYDTTHDNCSNVVIANGGSATCTITNNDQPAHLIVIKHVDNTNGGNSVASDFEMTINDVTAQGGNSFPGEENPGTNKIVNPGTYSVTESGPDGYESNFSTDCSGTIALGQTKTCTVTNDDKPATLIVIKHVVNDNGGQADASNFTMKVSGTNVSSSSFLGSEAGTSITLDAGSYSVDEDSVSGYEKTPGANCSGTISVGQTKTCTITNDDVAPTLTLLKTVINDDGGAKNTSNFKTYVDGIQTVWNVAVSVLANTQHTVSEDNLSGYSASAWGTDCSIDGKITLLPGENKTCSIINDDVAPTLTLVKLITNNNGGQASATNWTLNANGIERSFSGTTPATGTVKANMTYALSESGGPLGYTAGDWSCTGTGGLQHANNITLESGGNVTCTISNDDIAPTLKLVKTVIKNNGGTATASNWTLTASGTTNGFSDAGNSTTFHPVDANVTYALSESGPSGYDPSWWSCDGGQASGNTVLLNPGEQVTCTISNDDIAPTLKLVKNVTNDNGGNAVSHDWTLTATGEGGFSDAGDSTTFHTVKSGIGYILSESTVHGYLAGNWSCNGGNLTASTITLNLDQDVTCTITNDDIQPKLTITKVVTNDNGGAKVIADFPLYVDTTQVTSGQQNGFNAGIYTVREDNQSGYTAVISGDCAPNGSITLALGDVKSCTITNNDNQPGLHLRKTVTKDNGGTATDTDWILTATGTGQDPTNLTGTTPVDSGTSFKADTYTLSETGGPTGYTAGSWSCIGGTQSDNTITVALGESATCTINNNDNTPSLTLNKVVIEDNGGTAAESDWTLTADGGDAGILSGSGAVGDADVVSGASFKAGTYVLSESAGPAGYTASSWSCVKNGIPFSLTNPSIPLALGDTAICTITNYDIPATITGKKYNDLNGNGNDENGSDPSLENWTIQLKDLGGNIIQTDTTDSNGSYLFNNVTAGTYNVCEVEQLGWLRTNPTFSNCQEITVGLDEDLININFGNFELGKIKACKYEDFNGNGQKETEDLALANINILLYKQGEGWSVIDNKETGTDGCAIFNGLTVGQYKVEEDLNDPDLAGYYQSFSPQSYPYTIVSGSDYTGSIDTALFLNAKYRTISGQKFSDLNGNGAKDANEPGLENWTIFIDSNNNGMIDSGETSVQTDVNGNYEFTSLSADSYLVKEELQTGWLQTYPTNGFYDVDLHGTYSASAKDFGNTNKGRVTVYKYNDSDINGQKDENESYLSDWDVVLDQVEGSGATQQTNESGYTVFEPTSGQYDLYENLQPGWEQQSISCPMDDEEIGTYDSQTHKYTFTLNPQDDIICYIGNFVSLPELVITKDNDKKGSILNVGDIVTFTITVNNLGKGKALGVQVEDVAPVTAYFDYYKSSGNLDCGSGAASVTATGSNPYYWPLGDMDASELCTLTYQIKILSIKIPGTHDNLAFAFGGGGNRQTFYSNVVKDPFQIGTGTPSDYYKGEVQSNVLGASTTGQVLGASTGSSTLWLILSLLMIGLGTILKFFKKKNFIKIMKKMIPVLIMIISLFSFWKPILAVADTQAPSVSIVKLPEYMKDRGFEISYTAIDVGDSGLRDVTLDYMKDGGSWQGLGTYTEPSNKINVDSSKINEDTKYYFRATAYDNAGNPSAPDETYTTVDTSAPPKPENYSKEKLTSQTYKIKWHNAGSDDLYKVIVFRSDKKDYDANKDTEISRVDVTKNTDSEYMDWVVPDSTKDWYYALRSIDKAGNVSDLVGDTYTTYITVAGSSAPQGQAISGQGSVLGQEAYFGAEARAGAGGQILGEQIQESSPSPEASSAILGEGTAKDQTSQTKTDSRGIVLMIILGLGLIGLAWWFIKKNQSS